MTTSKIDDLVAHAEKIYRGVESGNEVIEIELAQGDLLVMIKTAAFHPFVEESITEEDEEEIERVLDKVKNNPEDLIKKERDMLYSSSV